jgi:hypothetical protein
LVGSTTSAGAWSNTKLKALSFTGSLTSAGSLLKSIARALFGSVISSGNLTKSGGTPALHGRVINVIGTDTTVIQAIGTDTTTIQVGGG